MNTQDFSPKIS